MTTLKKATYTRMDQSTPEDWTSDNSYKKQNLKQLPDSVMAMLKRLRDKVDGASMNGYDHSLQTATRAYDDGADDETIFIALFHDIGQVVSEENHSEVAAAILRPYISDRSHWIVQHHGIFQGYYFWHHIGKDRNARDAYRDNPYFDACVEWCDKYDQQAFDPDYPTKPLEFFEPIVRRILGRKPWPAHGPERGKA